jgi:hypothetical protein
MWIPSINRESLVLMLIHIITAACYSRCANRYVEHSPCSDRNILLATRCKKQTPLQIHWTGNKGYDKLLYRDVCRTLSTSPCPRRRSLGRPVQPSVGPLGCRKCSPQSMDRELTSDVPRISDSPLSFLFFNFCFAPSICVTNCLICSILVRGLTRAVIGFCRLLLTKGLKGWHNWAWV